jgi:hypothetical protein
MSDLCDLFAMWWCVYLVHGTWCLSSESFWTQPHRYSNYISPSTCQLSNQFNVESKLSCPPLDNYYSIIYVETNRYESSLMHRQVRLKSYQSWGSWYASFGSLVKCLGPVCAKLCRVAAIVALEMSCSPEIVTLGYDTYLLRQFQVVRLC